MCSDAPPPPETIGSSNINSMSAIARQCVRPRRLGAIRCLLRGLADQRVDNRSGLSFNRAPSSISVDRYRGSFDDKLFVPGQAVSARILYINDKGGVASVDDGAAHGLFTMTEIQMYQTVFGKDLRNGTVVSAYVGRNLPNTSPIHVNMPCLTLLLRPAIKARIECTADVVMLALEASATGMLPIGDKSTSEEVAEVFAGVSRKDFKKALGQLLTRGTVFPDDRATFLISRHADLVNQKLAEKNKPEGRTRNKPLFQSGQGRTLFVGPIPRTHSKADVEAMVNGAAGRDCVEAVKLATDKDGESKGYAYVLIDPRFKLYSIINACQGAVKLNGTVVRMNEHKLSIPAPSPSLNQPQHRQTESIETK